MNKLNVIIVYNKEKNKVLMCNREKEPYKGKLNLVGGKVEKNEIDLDAAYRELYEETGISKEDIKLIHIMKFEYEKPNFRLDVYAGQLKKNINLVEELNKLYWIDLKENFFDENRFAGEGNIGHMLKIAERFEIK